MKSLPGWMDEICTEHLQAVNLASARNKARTQRARGHETIVEKIVKFSPARGRDACYRYVIGPGQG